ncbi:MAG: hemolysin III family protein [Pirellulales bacterium]|nr:hemolysin III family protein [Pirellulales bacterium]
MPLISIPGFADPVSSLSHLVGAGVFLVMGTFLVRRGAGSAARMASLAIFSFGAVLLLSISGVYHLLQRDGTPREVLRVLDHAAIFVLIACSFMPPHVILFRGPWRWGMLVAVWTFAAAAITVKSVFFGVLPEIVGTGLYLGMGWIGLISGIALWRRFGFAFIAPLLWGGVAYSIGAVLDVLHWPVLVPGVVQWHEVFHVAVLAGLTLHWAFIYGIADGRLSPQASGSRGARKTCSAHLRS